MHFTREPVTETIITPREGFKLVVRNSKGAGQEEFFVDSVEIISFGTSCFYRSLEKPKPFLAPVSDYEVLEVRDTRLGLKHLGSGDKIKISGGRDKSLNEPSSGGSKRGGRRSKKDKEPKEETPKVVEEEKAKAETPDVDKKRDRRRHSRRKKQRDEQPAPAPPPIMEVNPQNVSEGGDALDEVVEPTSSSILPKIIPPPSGLISEDIARYKDAPFYQESVPAVDGEEVPVVEESEAPIIAAEVPAVEESEASVVEEEAPVVEDSEEPVVEEEVPVQEEVVSLADADPDDLIVLEADSSAEENPEEE